MRRRERNWRGIGWRAAVLRQLNGLDQAQAAELSGITLKTWQRLEAGRPVWVRRCSLSRGDSVSRRRYGCTTARLDLEELSRKRREERS
jgi:hypothetical protein